MGNLLHYLQQEQQQLQKQNGSTKNEVTGFGTMDNILEVVSEKKIKSPAIIVIGKVVETHPELAEVLSEINHY